MLMLLDRGGKTGSTVGDRASRFGGDGTVMFTKRRRRDASVAVRES